MLEHNAEQAASCSEQDLGSEKKKAPTPNKKADDQTTASKINFTENASKTKFISARPRLVEAEPKNSSPSDESSSKPLTVPESRKFVENDQPVLTKKIVSTPTVEAKRLPAVPVLTASELVKNALALPELQVKETSTSSTKLHPPAAHSSAA